MNPDIDKDQSPINASTDGCASANKEKKHRCYICGQKFPEKDVLKNHVKTHFDKPIPCEQCNRKFVNDTELLKHKKRIHCTAPNIMCEQCGKTVRTKSQLKRHIIRQHETELKRCMFCKVAIVYRNRKDVCGKCQQMGKRCASNGTISCSKCRTKFATPESINFHMLDSHGENNEILPHICPVCKKGFKTKFNCRTHLQKHSDVKNYHCDQCKAEFKTENGLTAHKQTHDQNRPFHCKTCDKSYKRECFYIEHLEYVHKEVFNFREIKKKVKCEYCYRDFVSKQEMHEHLALIHNVELFKCLKCSKLFKCKKTLRNHKCNSKGSK